MKKQILFLTGIVLSISLFACTSNTNKDTLSDSVTQILSDTTQEIQDDSVAKTEAETSVTNKSQESEQSLGKTRMIQTVKGPIEVPANPQRILTKYIEGDILALGGNLVAVNEPFKGSAFENQVKDLPYMTSWEQENVMAQDPDLIIIITEEDYDKYSPIAPTIFVPFTEITGAERLTFIGEILGKEEEAKTLLEEFDKKGKLAKEQLQKSTLDFSQAQATVLELWEAGSTMIVGDRWGRGGDIIYNTVGLKPIERVQIEIFDAPDTPYLLVSEEVLPDYAGGDIIFVSLQDNGMTGFENSPIWEALPAVKDNHVITIPFGLFYYDDILSQNAQLDLIVDGLVNLK